MIAHYGYRDASGEYFVSMDSAKCTACEKCVEVCPADILEMGTVFVDLEDKPVAQVREGRRKSVKEDCAGCDHRGGEPCIKVCEPGAIIITWNRLS